MSDEFDSEQIMEQLYALEKKLNITTNILLRLERTIKQNMDKRSD